MTFPKVITRTSTTTAQRRKAKRASRSYGCAIIVFRHENDEACPHFRTLKKFDDFNVGCYGAHQYWNYVGSTPMSFQKPNGVKLHKARESVRTRKQAAGI